MPSASAKQQPKEMLIRKQISQYRWKNKSPHACNGMQKQKSQRVHP